MSYESHISLNRYWITCQMLCMCVCVVLSKFQNGKDSRHEKEGPSVIRLEFNSNYKLKWNKN